LYSFVDTWVSVGHVGMTVIGEWVGDVGMTVIDEWVWGMFDCHWLVQIESLRKLAAVALSSPQIPHYMSRLTLHLNGLLVETVPADWRYKFHLTILLALRRNNAFFVFWLYAFSLNTVLLIFSSICFNLLLLLLLLLLLEWIPKQSLLQNKLPDLKFVYV
jgi:hypothetical protein